MLPIKVMGSHHGGVMLTDKAITAVGTAATVTIQAGVAARRWWRATGQERAVNLIWGLVRVVALLLLFMACLACTVWVGFTALADKIALSISLDNPAPHWGGSVDWSRSEESADMADGQVLADWAFAKFGRFQGTAPDADALVAWAKSRWAV